MYPAFLENPMKLMTLAALFCTEAVLSLFQSALCLKPREFFNDGASCTSYLLQGLYTQGSCLTEKSYVGFCENPRRSLASGGTPEGCPAVPLEELSAYPGGSRKD